VALVLPMFFALIDNRSVVVVSSSRPNKTAQDAGYRIQDTVCGLQMQNAGFTEPSRAGSGELRSTTAARNRRV
jgi:hypothetical protein